MLKLFIKSFNNWFNDDPFTQGAAAAYYAIFSFPGLLIITMSVAAFAFDQQQVETQVVSKLSQMLGAETAQDLNEIAQETQRKDRDIWALVIGLLTLSFGATGLFAHLQRALNQIFEVEVKDSAGIWLFIKSRLISFGVVLMLGFLLLISLSMTAVINLLSEWVAAQFSPEFSIAILVVNILISFFLTVLLFALIYRILPDAQLAWRSAFMGGVVAAVFFKIGEQALTVYFELAEPQSSFGAAGSLVLLMLWVSYSCMILLLGAEFAKVHERVKHGKVVKPSDIAKKSA